VAEYLYWGVECQGCKQPIPLLEIQFRDDRIVEYRWPRKPFILPCPSCKWQGEYDGVEIVQVSLRQRVPANQLPSVFPQTEEGPQN